MLIFGVRSVQVNAAKTRKVTCTNCGKKGLITVKVFRKHFHLFWIPMFPVFKTGSSQCGNCGEVLEPKEMPKFLKNEFLKVKSDSSGPYWQFSGLALAAGLALYFNHVGEQDRIDEQEYLSKPSQGDVYMYKISRGSYSSLKVDSVSFDSVFVYQNDQSTFRRSKVYFINRNENYSYSSYGISRKRIEEMYGAEDIFDILRSKKED